MKRRLILGLTLIAIAAGIAAAQQTPWLYRTLLPREQMDLIVGEASGETARRTIMDINGYNRERFDAEYTGNFWETQVIAKALKSYGFTDAQIVTYPSGEAWRGLKGELWELSPFRQKLASFQDEVAMLVNGSQPADVTAELVWVGSGTKAEIDAAKVEGKIVVTEGSASGVHSRSLPEPRRPGRDFHRHVPALFRSPADALERLARPASARNRRDRCARGRG